MPDYVAKFSRRFAELERRVSQMSQSRLSNSSIEDGGIPEYDLDGQLMSRVGKQYDDTHAPVTYAGPVPPTPAGVTVTGGPTSIKVAWDGTFAKVLVSPLDWSALEVHASPDPLFVPDPLPDSATRVGVITQAAGGSLTFQPATGIVYVRCVSRSQAGKFSGPTDPVDAYGNPSPAQVGFDGDGTFATVNSIGDISVGGQKLMGGMLDPAAPSLGLLEQQAWGIQGMWDFRALSTFSATISETTIMLGQFDVILRGGRSYEVRLPWRAGLIINAGTPAQLSGSVRAYATLTTDGTEPPDPTVDSTELVADYSIRAPAAASVGQSGLLVVNVPVADTLDVVRAKIGIAATAGTGTRFIPDTYGNNSWVAVITDVGPNQPVLMAAEPGQGSAQKYITTWTANGSRSWSASGGVYTIDGSTTKFIRQGNSGATVWHGAFSCGAAATAGADAGKTIAQALAGGSTLLKAEVWVQITWSEYDVGQVELRPLGANSVPSSLPSPGTSSNIVKHDYPARQSGAWIEVPTTWFTTSNNGCIIASPDWTFSNTNAQFAGAGHPTGSWRPKVRLTYTR